MNFTLKDISMSIVIDAKPKPTSRVVEDLKDAGEDFEWYPTTQKMVNLVGCQVRHMNPESIMDIGAGDGRVLQWLGDYVEQENRTRRPALYSIEKSEILRSLQPPSIIPVGTDVFTAEMMFIEADIVFCNPPYSEFEVWASMIIESAFARAVYLVLPQRWKTSQAIRHAIQVRGGTDKVLGHDTFHNADRAARAVVDIIEVQFPGRWPGKRSDPFKVWFDANIDSFEVAPPALEGLYNPSEMAVRGRKGQSAAEMVEQYEAERERLQRNYEAVFKMDREILKELGVDANAVQEGVKKKIADLKGRYWTKVFDQFEPITARLTSKTRKTLMEQVAGRAGVAFTAPNIYAIVAWAVGNANLYFDKQLVDLFTLLSSDENTSQYVSSHNAWTKDMWRFRFHQDEGGPTHYKLDYRIVHDGYRAIGPLSGEFSTWDFKGGLHESAHNIIDDIKAVMGNLGYSTRHTKMEDEPWKDGEAPSRDRNWVGGLWQDFTMSDGRVLFQAKAFQNGNIHLRFLPEAIMAFNVQAGRLLKWLRSPQHAAEELAIDVDTAEKYFRSQLQIDMTSMPMLTNGASNL
jgi:hypothetical protein